LFFNWTVSTPGQLANIKDMETFFQDAYLGTLPEFTFIEPSCCAVGTTSMHPSGLIADGEVLLKQIYDAVRGGPQWENMLFIITFDETGGFHDHKDPPRATPPDDLTFTSSTPDGGNYTFGFDRLGGRVPTWLISPWVDVGHVEQLGTNAQGQQIAYSATSILRTLGYLWDFEPFNPRIAESPSFDHLIGTKMRKNTPETMPVPIKF
jgi:phospholipase C